MSGLAQSLVTWPEFFQLPERPDGGKRYELHDGEVKVAPLARPLDIKLQKRIEGLLERLAGDRGFVTIEFPYRPVLNLQYWFADVAYIPKAAWDALPSNDYPVYSPPLIVEVLSPSNTPAKINRQRIVAMSAGTEVFWVVDADAGTVQVADADGTRIYGSGESVSAPIVGGAVRVDDIFDV